jgi:hypothetical protein
MFPALPSLAIYAGVAMLLAGASMALARKRGALRVPFSQHFK